MVVRLFIIGAVLAVAFTLYTLVDAAMTDASRARGVSKPVWVVLTIVLPVIGGILWLTIGKGDGRAAARPVTPDDDPRFGAMSSTEMDKRIADLEDQLRALDDEVFPGEETGTADPEEEAAGDQRTSNGDDPTGGSDAPGSPDSPDQPEPPRS